MVARNNLVTIIFITFVKIYAFCSWDAKAEGTLIANKKKKPKRI